MIHAVTTSGSFEEILRWLPTLPDYDQHPAPSKAGCKSEHDTDRVLLFEIMPTHVRGCDMYGFLYGKIFPKSECNYQ